MLMIVTTKDFAKLKFIPSLLGPFSKNPIFLTLASNWFIILKTEKVFSFLPSSKEMCLY